MLPKQFAQCNRADNQSGIQAASQDSLIPITRGIVASIINGSRTGTAFSAAPNALSDAPTTIKRTEPVYCGKVIVCLCLPFLARLNGPRNLTIGLNRCAFCFEGSGN